VKIPALMLSGIFRRLFLELGHAPELAMRRDRGNRPGQFRVLGNGRLHEEGRLRRIDAAGKQIRGHVAHPARHLSGLEWLGDGVVVHHAEEAAVLVLERDPVAHGPKVVSQVQFARGLDAGKNGFARGRGAHGSRRL
jgi:hypothetical protein